MSTLMQVLAGTLEAERDRQRRTGLRSRLVASAAACCAATSAGLSGIRGRLRVRPTAPSTNTDPANF